MVGEAISEQLSGAIGGLPPGERLEECLALALIETVADRRSLRHGEISPVGIEVEPAAESEITGRAAVLLCREQTPILDSRAVIEHCYV